MMFFLRMWFLYGCCLRFVLFVLCYYMSPRLPSSGNRRVLYAVFYLYNFVWLVRCFFCCFFVGIAFALFIIEGGGFIDLPGIKYYTRILI
uniref:Putative ribosomal protein subunit 12 n=1 Tax=Trypanosoma lewisi TaxID=5695 RepID=A0A7G4WFF3_TRYLE|nr:putative ribosomal protein subunit 12 [Trypanosoma lewisi]